MHYPFIRLEGTELVVRRAVFSKLTYQRCIIGVRQTEFVRYTTAPLRRKEMNQQEDNRGGLFPRLVPPLLSIAVGRFAAS